MVTPYDKYELPSLPTIDVMGKTSPQIWFTAAEVNALRLAAIEPYVKRIAELEAQIEADRQRRGEPVVWRTYDRNGWYVFSTTREEAERDFPGKDHQPLYAAPVAAQPSVSLNR